jgi:anti-sigma factor RsiW
MECKEFKQWFQDHETIEMTRSAQDHLDSCEKCQKLLELDQKLDQKLHKLLQPLEVPERLKERLDQNFSETGFNKGNPIVLWKKSVPAFAIAAMLVFLLFPFSGRENSFASMDQLGEYAATDHASHGISDCSVRSIGDIGTWSARELGYKLNWPTVPQGATLVGANKCRLGKCDTAHLIYSQNGTRFSVYVFSKKMIVFDLIAGNIHSTKIGDYGVELWEKGDQVQVTVL